ncbi:hypothetical protein LINPERHAP1_LOCUS38753 [Linum perenne]
MGKRKERRLAALGNSNRRVKLDLFAEPSGDLGGSSVHNEVGGDGDPTQSAGLPTLPSSSGGFRQFSSKGLCRDGISFGAMFSCLPTKYLFSDFMAVVSSMLSDMLAFFFSGQQPQNPLLLLGQYSDDEIDDEKNQDRNHGANDSSSTALTKQDIHPDEGNEKDNNGNGVEDLAIQSDGQQDMNGDSIAVDAAKSVKHGESRDSDVTANADTSKPLMLAEKSSVGEATPQVAEDVISGWRMVLHDETNQYYYWNTETGETSWEVPIALAQMGYTLKQETSVAESTSLPVSESYNNLASNVGGVYFPVSTVDSSTVVSYVSLSEEANGSMQESYAFYQQVGSEPPKDESFIMYPQQNELERNSISVHAPLCNVNSVQDEPSHVAMSAHIQKEVTDISSSLRTRCQCLLERLKSLTGFEGHPQDRDRMFKYITELETRLFDIESLSSYGSSLLPFWMHSEGRLKQLEDTINNEIYQLAVSAQLEDDVDKSIISCEGMRKNQDGLLPESLLDGPGSCKQNASLHTKESSPIEGASGSIPFDGHNSPSGKFPENAMMSAAGNETADLKSESLGIEDVDMDIDMEVDDVPTNTTPSKNTHHSNSALVEEPTPSNLPAESISFMVGESSAIPPPEEEWIPPPPSDTELVPPPPPDDDFVPPLPLEEPPDSSYSMLPCSGQMGQPMSYTEHYSFPYVDSTFQYYNSAATLPSGYVHIDGSQAAIPQASLYYGPVSTTYSETPPVEQIASYDLHTVPPGTLVTGLESSNLPTSFGTAQSDPSHVLDATRSVNSGPLLKPESLVAGIQIDSGNVQPSSNMNNQAPDLSDNKGTLSAAASASAPSSNAKVQSKASRGKKRTVSVATSLRSNKKVSSLVDKWKAVKEEMHEDEEDEPENALEILEKKRQKEIEEWRAKQITSGEAKDNANFQPLGGDWREKVKRRRALAAKEDGKKQPETGVDAKQQPDLAELSRGLPTGWQVYWDEASKQVYYGNAVTSETSWSRPSK